MTDDITAPIPAPDQPNPDQLNPDQLNPDQLNPDQLNPDQLNPDHLSPEQLADRAEGLLGERVATAATVHLQSCPQCRATQAALTAVPRLLATAAPERIPADVASRVGAALALAAQQRSASREAGSASVAPAEATVTSLGAVRDHRAAASRLRRMGAALVGVAAVLGGGFLFTQGLPSFGGSDEPSAGAAGLEESARDGDAARDPAGPNDTAGEGATAEGFAPTGASGIDYAAATLVADVTELLAQSQPTTLGTESRTEFPATDSPSGAEAGTASCADAVAAAAGIREPALAVDVATYEGKPAVIVVLALPASEAADGEIWVVGASCLTSPEVSRLDRLARVTLDDVPGRD